MIHRLYEHARWRIAQRERDRRARGRKGFLPMPKTEPPVTYAVTLTPSEGHRAPDCDELFDALVAACARDGFAVERVQVSPA